METKLKEWVKSESFSPKPFTAPVKSVLWIWLEIQLIIFAITLNSHVIRISETSAQNAGKAGIVMCFISVIISIVYRLIRYQKISLNDTLYYLGVLGCIGCFAAANALPLEPYKYRLIFVTLLGTFFSLVLSRAINAKFASVIKQIKKEKIC